MKEVKKGEEELLLIHFNKQRIKSFKELINEYLILDGYYRKGQGKRTDLTSVKSNRSSSRDIISSEMGISSSQPQRLVYIHRNRPEYIELLDKGILTVNQSYLQIQRVRIGIRPIYGKWNYWKSLWSIGEEICKVWFEEIDLIINVILDVFRYLLNKSSLWIFSIISS